MDLQKLERLQRVLSKIENLGKDECNFMELEKLRQSEYHQEGGKNAEYVMGDYRHNLEQTGWKQAESYKDALNRRGSKGAHSKFVDYVSNLEQDVREELRKVETFLKISDK